MDKRIKLKMSLSRFLNFEQFKNLSKSILLSYFLEF